MIKPYPVLPNFYISMKSSEWKVGLVGSIRYIMVIAMIK